MGKYLDFWHKLLSLVHSLSTYNPFKNDYRKSFFYCQVMINAKYTTYIIANRIPSGLLTVFFVADKEYTTMITISTNTIGWMDIGWITVNIPKINRILNKFYPTIFPIEISLSPFLVAIILVINSGSEVQLSQLSFNSFQMKGQYH